MSYRMLTVFIGILALASIGVVGGLLKYSERLKAAPNEFLRLFPPHPILERDTFLLGYHSYYLAGMDNENVYLGNYDAQLHIAVANFESRDTTYSQLRIPDVERMRFKSIRVKASAPYIYLADGTVPVIYRASIGEWSAERYLADSIFFMDFLPVSAHSLAIRSLSSQNGENMLGLLSERAPYVSFNQAALQKQLDGVFCTDGMMCFNEASGSLVYVHLYRNEVLLLDSTMAVVRRTRTLDTTSHVRIKTATISSENTRTLTAPPYFVNLGAKASDNRLFVRSALLARNQHPDAFSNAAVIDVYSLPEMKYHFSFHIYDYWGGSKLREFTVYNNRFVALFDNQLLVYELQQQLFDW
jgi:hypothetical protein